MVTQPQKILILAAIPQGLRLDKEIREIEDAIRRASKRDLFEIKTRTAVRPQDIRRAIAEEKPKIVHFCGHGLENGSLLLEDDAGQDKPVTPQGLASLFKLHAPYVDCVLLNACHSVKSAEAISEYINYVIGMNQQIQDRSAIQFSQGFYDGLGYQIQNDRDVFQRAFEEGRVAIELENLSQGDIPHLKIHKSMNKPLPVKSIEPEKLNNRNEIQRQIYNKSAFIFKTVFGPNIDTGLNQLQEAIIEYLASADDILARVTRKSYIAYIRELMIARELEEFIDILCENYPKNKELQEAKELVIELLNY